MKIGKWIKEEGDYVTPGGTPYYICEKCGKSGHLYGVEFPRRKERCDVCGSVNYYPWEWYKMSEVANDEQGAAGGEDHANAAGN